MSPGLVLELELERLYYQPGETVRGTVRVFEGGRTRRLQAFVRFKERTEDYDELGATFASGILREGDLREGEEHSFEIPLPSDALPTYVSGHGELYWEAGMVSDEPGVDSSAWLRIVVDTRPPPPEAEEPRSVWLSPPGTAVDSSG